MSARSAICKAIADKIKAEFIEGSAIYNTNLYNNVSSKLMFWEDINDFPFVTVSPGPEQREDMPSGLSWCIMQTYIRVFVENEEDAQGQLEEIISDLETFVDKNLNIQYNIRITGGTTVTRKTIDNSIVSITTDEGLLDPKAVGEIVLDIRYEKLRTQ